MSFLSVLYPPLLFRLPIPIPWRSCYRKEKRIAQRDKKKCTKRDSNPRVRTHYGLNVTPWTTRASVLSPPLPVTPHSIHRLLPTPRYRCSTSPLPWFHCLQFGKGRVVAFFAIDKMSEASAILTVLLSPVRRKSVRSLPVRVSACMGRSSC